MKGDFLTSAFRHIRSRMASGRGAMADEEDPEDALQEAFCRLWKNRERYDGAAQAEGSLATAVRNIRIDGYRRNQTHQKVNLSELNDPPAETAESLDEVMDLYREVDRLVRQHLSERDRGILYHRDKDGWEFDEIAEHYHLSEANVRMIVSRGRRTIREIYQKQKGNRDGRER